MTLLVLSSWANVNNIFKYFFYLKNLWALRTTSFGFRFNLYTRSVIWTWRTGYAYSALTRVKVFPLSLRLNVGMGTASLRKWGIDYWNVQLCISLLVKCEYYSTVRLISICFALRDVLHPRDVVWQISCLQLWNVLQNTDNTSIVLPFWLLVCVELFPCFRKTSPSTFMLLTL